MRKTRFCENRAPVQARRLKIKARHMEHSTQSCKTRHVFRYRFLIEFCIDFLLIFDSKIDYFESFLGMFSVCEISPQLIIGLAPQQGIPC